MSQSLVQNYLHISFSTKYRQPLILPPFENELHTYLGGICTELECYPVKIGGYNDHVHIVCSLSKKIALMTFMEKIKSHSSKWMKTKDPSLSNFYWQGGYGAVSVRAEDLEDLIRYIENQHEHHKKVSFKEEFIEFLKKHNVQYDERYVWD